MMATLSEAVISVVAGRWNDPYTGGVFTVAQDLDLDHVVPLRWAWERGASVWNGDRRERFRTILQIYCPLASRPISPRARWGRFGGCRPTRISPASTCCASPVSSTVTALSFPPARLRPWKRSPPAHAIDVRRSALVQYMRAKHPPNEHRRCYNGREQGSRRRESNPRRRW